MVIGIIFNNSNVLGIFHSGKSVFKTVMFEKDIRKIERSVNLRERTCYNI